MGENRFSPEDQQSVDRSTRPQETWRPGRPEETNEPQSEPSERGEGYQYNPERFQEDYQERQPEAWRPGRSESIPETQVQGDQVGDTAFDVSDSVGDPEKLAVYWQQQETNFDCGIMSQKTAMDAYGKDIPAESLREMGERMNPPGYNRNPETPDMNGTSADQIGFGFEAAGVGRTIETWETPEDAQLALHNELAQRHAVITAVDAGTLWNDPEAGGHALWVTGAAYSQGELKTVYANDTGRPDGAAKSYDGPTFIAAWEKYNYRMASTTEPLP